MASRSAGSGVADAASRGALFALRAGLSSPDSQCMPGVGAAAQRRRRRPLFAGRHMPIDEPLGIVREIVVGVEGPLEHLAGDVLGHVPGPSLGRVESDHAERIAVLAGEKIANDGLAIGLGGVSLIVGDAELSVVVQNQVHGDVVRILRCRAGHGTQLAGTGTQRPPILAPNEPQKSHRQKMPGARLILIFDGCRSWWGTAGEKSDAVGGRVG
jgi:hypothetical protein